MATNEAKLERTAGTLAVTRYYELTDAEIRPHGWSRDKKYLPTILVMSFTATGMYPAYSDLKLDGATLHGYVIKQDGKPGQREHTERLYSYQERPEWLLKLAAETLKELREAGE